MKKNRMMRLASMLLVAVLMTTCTISGTFAKYVTKGEASDTARVAKWGVTVTPNGTIFAKEYDVDDGTYSGTGDKSVISSDEWDVIAPGTTKSMTEVQITGTPEVATRVTYDADVALDGDWIVAGDEYCPIIFTVEGKTYGMYGMPADYTFGTMDVLEQAVEEAIAKLG